MAAGTASGVTWLISTRRGREIAVVSISILLFLTAWGLRAYEGSCTPARWNELSGERSHELLAEAARLELARLERQRIDAEFAAMATDPSYGREAVRLAAELVGAGWEALRMVEDEP